MLSLSRRRARRDYEAAVRVLNHASLTHCSHLPTNKIGALEALRLYHDAFVSPPDSFERMDRRAAEEPVMVGEELPEQAALIEAARKRV